MSMPVIMYHRIGDGDRYAVAVRDFERQISYLARSGYRAVVPDDLTGKTPPAGRCVMITFDDGHETDHAVALPVLSRYGFRGVSFVTTGFIGKPGYMTWGNARALAAAGWSVLSHGHVHLLLACADAVTLRHELLLSRHLLQTEVGGPVNGLSLPGGSCSRRVIDEAHAFGYRYIFGSCPSVNHAGTAPAGLFGRIPVAAGTTDETFRKIVLPDARHYARARRDYYARSIIKYIVGAERYHRFWRRYCKAGNAPQGGAA